MAKGILLAEDSPDDELLFKRILEKNKVANPIAVVRDGGEAIAYLEGEGNFADRNKYPLPEILVLDLRMPGLDGFAVLEWLEKNSELKKKLLLIVLTQFGDANQIRRAYNLWAHSFLSKPFTHEDSENLIRHYAEYWTRSDSGGASAANP